MTPAALVLERFTSRELKAELRRRRMARECERKRVERRAKRLAIYAQRFALEDIEILDTLLNNPQGMTVAEVADYLGPSPQATRGRLKRLMGKGVVFTYGTHPSVWTITRRGREVHAEDVAKAAEAKARASTVPPLAQVAE